MKKLSVLAVAFLAGSIAATAAYNVTGKIENNGGTRIYLVTRTGTNTIDTIATSLTPDGSFVFKGDVGAAPIAAEILSEGSRMRVPVMLEDGREYDVKADVRSPQAWTVSGGGDLQRIRNEFHDIELEHSMRCDSVENYYRSNYDLNDYFWRLQLKGALNDEVGMFDARRDEFVSANDNLVSASVLVSDIRRLVNEKTVHKKYAMLGANARNTVAGKILEAEAERMMRIVVGGTAPDFTMPTPSGETLSLYGVKAKVKILDFWASWCGPCRAENPTLRKLYAEYAPKGLEIISVSLDTDKDAWIKAIKDDGMTWKHVSELGEGNTPKSVYNIFAIPHMFILDENNRIISDGLRGERLIEFIAGQFKD